jgi:hypothetical protein
MFQCEIFTKTEKNVGAKKFYVYNCTCHSHRVEFGPAQQPDCADGGDGVPGAPLQHETVVTQSFLSTKV